MKTRDKDTDNVLSMVQNTAYQTKRYLGVLIRGETIRYPSQFRAHDTMFDVHYIHGLDHVSRYVSYFQVYFVSRYTLVNHDAPVYVFTPSAYITYYTQTLQVQICQNVLALYSVQLMSFSWSLFLSVFLLFLQICIHRPSM